MAVSPNMSTVAPPVAITTGKKALLGVVGLLAFYFAYEQVIPYFVWSEEAYGYYWQFRLSLLLHVVGGLIGLVALAAAWLAVTGTAIYCIRLRRVEAHKQWMVRSYVLTFGFVTFRIIVDHVPYEALWGIPRPEMANAMIWSAWVVPLIVYEVLLGVRRQ